MRGAWKKWCAAAGYTGPFAKCLPALRETIVREARTNPAAFAARLERTKAETERARTAQLKRFRKITDVARAA